MTNDQGDSLSGVHQRSCSAVVLAGGRSKRFGSDKLKVRVAGEPLLDRAITAVGLVTDNLVVVGRIHSTTRSIEEPEPRRGPLNAVSYALEFASMDCVLVVAGDHPFIEPGLLALLVDVLGSHEAAVPVDRNGLAQPLIAAYRRSLRDQMREQVRGDRLGINDFLGGIDVRWVEPGEWEREDYQGLSFLDIDTAADLAMLQTAPVDHGSGAGPNADS